LLEKFNAAAALIDQCIGLAEVAVDLILAVMSEGMKSLHQPPEKSYVGDDWSEFVLY
jgi:hypothetical protein